MSSSQLRILAVPFMALAVVLTTGLSATGQPATHAPAPVEVGASRINITPTLPVTLAGYASRTELSTGVHDSLFARAVAFRSGSARLVVVSTDILGLYHDTAEPLRQSIMTRHGLSSDELFLASVHTHAAPTVGLDSTRVHPNNVAYTAMLENRLVEVVGQALARLGPADLQIGLGSSPVGVNRRQVSSDSLGNARVVLGRNPEGVHNRQVQVLYADTQDGPDALLFGYAVHSTSLGPGNLLISGDIHGLAERFVETTADTDVVAAAFAGASGDIDPWYRVLPGFRTTAGWIPEPVLMATMLGQEVIHLTNRLEPIPAGGGVRSRTEQLWLPGKPTGESSAPANHPPASLAVGVARVGDVGFVCLGAEVLTEVGSAIEAASPFATTIVLTHCNGASGYLPPAHLYPLGGYEIRSAPFGPKAAGEVVRHVTARLHELARE